MRTSDCLLRAGGAAIVALLTACTTTAPVNPNVPVPVVDPVPVTMGVHFSEELKNFEYREEDPGQQHWIVQMGSANVAMFGNVLGSMFEEMVVVEETGSSEDRVNGVDAVIRPEVESYEFAIPSDWGTNTFTVWITYRLNMYRPDGSLIASWPVRAYGESRHQWFSADESLADATTMAMRDAGAYLTLYFEDEPKIREWLREEIASSRAPGSDRGRRPARRLGRTTR